MRLTLAILIVVFVSGGCKQSTRPIHFKTNTVKATRTVLLDTIGAKGTPVAGDTVPVIADTTKLLLSNKTDHIFSNIKSKDRFEITLYGDSITTGTIIFRIFSSSHHLLYKHTYAVHDMLIDYAELPLAARTDTICSRVAHFFDKSQFVFPAISKGETLDSSLPEWNVTDKANWKAIKADSTAIGFVYSYGYESTYGIAYAKAKHKVVGIFYSD